MKTQKLKNKADYISNNFEKFPTLSQNAKKEWMGKGNKIRSYYRERLTETVLLLDYSDLRAAVYDYVLNHEDEIKEMEERSQQRQKYKRAKQKVENGLIPIANGNRLRWISGKSKKVDDKIRHNFFPVSSEKKLFWVQAPFETSFGYKRT